jgi:hypothetical protein
MVMNVNARIDWQTGMEITAQTFTKFDENIVYRQQVASRIMNGNRFGLIPFSKFDCQAGFVKNTLEIERLSCMALLPSGKVLHIDEKVVVPIPMLYGEEYFLACGFGEKSVGFDIETVPFVQPEYVFGIYSLAELEGSDLFPIMKFKVDDGIFSFDKEYIPPCLCLAGDTRFFTYLQRLADEAAALGKHPNLEAGEGKRALMHYAFRLKNYTGINLVSDFIGLTQEMAQAIDYYVVAPNTETGIAIKAYNAYDPVAWLQWLEMYMHGTVTILDKVVLEDHSIDFDALKAQIKAELYEQLRPELYNELHHTLHQELNVEITQELTNKLMDYINGRLKEDLHALLAGELSDELFKSLFKALYDSLYKALFVPVEKEEEDFVPLI